MGNGTCCILLVPDFPNGNGPLFLRPDSPSRETVTSNEGQTGIIIVNYNRGNQMPDSSKDVSKEDGNYKDQTDSEIIAVTFNFT